MSEEQETFNKKIIQAVKEKQKWFDVTELPKIQEDYRLHLTCVRNLFDLLIKRSLIIPDPYKSEKKITEIVCPESSEFSDNEKAINLGSRLSDYESMIDYICNYMRFSVEQLSMDKIKKLLELNSTFNWNGLTLNAAKANTRALASCLNILKTGAPQLTQSLIKDSITKSSNAINQINATLKQLAQFQRELYKAEVREKVIANPSFSIASFNSAESLFSEIKKNYSANMKRSFSTELINEIVAEETSANKQDLQQNLLADMQVKQESVQKSKNTIDTHEALMDVVRNIGSLTDQYSIILTKIIANHEILESEKNSFKDKFKRFIRKMFGRPEPVVEYPIILIDKNTGAKKKEVIHYQEFIESLNKRIKYYASFAVKQTPGYNRISAQSEDAIADMVNRHITENNHLFILLGGLDDYFKNTAIPADRQKIKGITMELTTTKNILVKIKQMRAEYTSYIEEAEQMKKLGITDSI